MAGGGPGGAMRRRTPTSRWPTARSPRRRPVRIPGDGSNGPNVLTESGIVRSDITSSFGSASGVAEGVPLTVRLKVYDLTGEDATALAGAAVYLWHCDREGRYSMYAEEIADENYLRGVQEADADGRVEFTTIFPAATPGAGRTSTSRSTRAWPRPPAPTNKLRTSQLAFPEDTCTEVYATDGLRGERHQPGPDVSLDTDGVFSDGYSLQLATVTGSVDDGYIDHPQRPSSERVVRLQAGAMHRRQADDSSTPSASEVACDAFGIARAARCAVHRSHDDPRGDEAGARARCRRSSARRRMWKPPSTSSTDDPPVGQSPLAHR